MRLLRNSLIGRRSSLAQLPNWRQTGSQVTRSAFSLAILRPLPVCPLLKSHSNSGQAKWASLGTSLEHPAYLVYAQISRLSVPRLCSPFSLPSPHLPKRDSQRQEMCSPEMGSLLHFITSPTIS